jgi:hypothetical protein
VWCWGQFVDRGRGRIDYLGDAVSLGGSCGIRTDGVAVCYDTGVEVEVPGSLRPDMIGKASYSTQGCAIVSGEVWCWTTGVASQVPGITGAVDVDARGCAATTTGTRCWDPSDPSTLVDYYPGAATQVYRGPSTGSGVCIEKTDAVYCDGRNVSCAFRSTGERAVSDTGLTFTSIAAGDTYTFGSGYCEFDAGIISCRGVGASFGGSTPCDERLVYGTARLTEVSQLVPGCALLRAIPGPMTIECWDAGSPAPIAW